MEDPTIPDMLDLAHFNTQDGGYVQAVTFPMDRTLLLTLADVFTTRAGRVE